MFSRFFRDRRGNVALIFGLAVVPVVGFAGAALDYSRASQFKNFLAKQTDIAALAIAASDGDVVDQTLAALKAAAQTRYSPNTSNNPVKDVTVSASWVNSAVLRVTATTSFSNSLVTAVPFTPAAVTVSSVSEVTRTPPIWQWTLPDVSDLSYEAADYNRISVYCYDVSKKSEPTKGRRMETLIAIADNGGTSFKGVVLPLCKQGETISYQLRNVRNARITPAKWDDKTAEHYLYYTDTTDDPNTRVLTNNITGGREYPDGSMLMTDLTRAPILETILCASKSVCQSKSDGGILPNNHQTGRTPATATGGCAEGSYMYYGWEDRPPVNPGDSDTDYDDIRLVVSCPSLVKVADKLVRLSR